MPLVRELWFEVGVDLDGILKASGAVGGSTAVGAMVTKCVLVKRNRMEFDQLVKALGQLCVFQSDLYA